MSAPHSDVPTATKGLMKAWAFVKTGLPSAVLKLHEGRPLPIFPPEQRKKQHAEEWILVRVSHTGLNPAGVYQIRLIPAWLRSRGSKSEAIPEVDLAGTVLEVWHPGEKKEKKEAAEAKNENEGKGEQTAKGKENDTEEPRFQAGDKIWASIDLPHVLKSGVGALADHVAIPARFAVRRPDRVDPLHAAGLGMATFTAKSAVDAACLLPGNRVLVVAAAGGIGSAAVQLAREAVGPEGFVAGVCKGEKIDAVLSLGADDVVDYTAFESLPDELARRFSDNPFDAVIDCIGLQHVYHRCAKFVRKGGKYAAVNMLAKDWTLASTLWAASKAVVSSIRPASAWLGGSGRKFILVGMKYPSKQEREEIIGKVADGRLEVLVDSVWEYRDALGGYDVLMERRATGKVIVKWDENAGGGQDEMHAESRNGGIEG